MKFRTSYLVGLMATVLAVSSTAYFIDPAVAADAPRLKPPKSWGQTDRSVKLIINMAQRHPETLLEHSAKSPSRCQCQRLSK